MPKVETRITINAQKDAIWPILTDFNQYPQWNPVVVRAKRRGAKLLITLNVEGKKAILPTKIVREDGHELRWEGAVPFVDWLMSGSHYFILEDNGDGTTTLVHGEEFGGLLPRLSWSLIGPKLEHGYQALNQALKRQAEQASQ